MTVLALQEEEQCLLFHQLCCQKETRQKEDLRPICKEASKILLNPGSCRYLTRP